MCFRSFSLFRLIGSRHILYCYSTRKLTDLQVFEISLKIVINWLYTTNSFKGYLLGVEKF